MTDAVNKIGIIIEAPTLNPTDIETVGEEIEERLNVLGTRSETIVTTETIQGNQHGSINTIVRENERINKLIEGLFTPDEMKKIKKGGLEKLLKEVEGVDDPFARHPARDRLRADDFATLEAGGFNVRWVTKYDNRVRDLHRRWHGKIMTPDEARKNVTISPWGCRCGLYPVTARDNTDKKNKKWDDERKELLLL